MKRKRNVSNCLVCGKKANVSKWWTRSEYGKTYFYIRFYHSAKNIHLLPADSTYSGLPINNKKSKNLYSALENYVYRKLDPGKHSYTALKKALERTYGSNIYNQEFSRAINRAISAGLIKKEPKRGGSVYERVAPIDLDERIRFDQLVISYSLTNESVKISTFLEVTNTGKIQVSKLPFYVPLGPINSLKNLNLHARDEIDNIPQSNLKIIFSATQETIISASLNRPIKAGEKKCTIVHYKLRKMPISLKFVLPAEVILLRINIIVDKQYKGTAVRTLVDGAKESIFPFQKKYSCVDGRVCSQLELEGIARGECITIKLQRG